MSSPNEHTMSIQQELHEKVEYNLTLHPPQSPEVIERMEAIRAKSKELSHLMIDLCPDSRDLHRALTAIEDGNRCAIAALALHQHRLPEPHPLWRNAWRNNPNETSPLPSHADQQQ